jgi:5'-nucleotidase
LREILITNDDGIHSPGILALAESVASLGRVTLVAPDRERSAASQSLTIQRPLRYEEVSPGHFAVDGTPADCVLIALHHILPAPPDLVISGINRGANLGHDVGYSGTVAAALEAAHNKVSAFAISQATGDRFDFEEAARIGAKVAGRIFDSPLPVETILNVNVPAGKVRGIRVTRQGIRNAESMIVEHEDPRGHKLFWFDQKYAPRQGGMDQDEDWQVVNAGYVSITPLKLDRTAYEVMDLFSSWSSSFFE